MKLYQWISVWIGAIAVSVGSASLAAPDGSKDLVLGQSAPLSGPFAAMGRDYRNGALLAFEEVNQRGGIFGRSIRLTTLDDAYNAEKAIANTRALIAEHRALSMFNHMFTNTVRGSLPIAVAANVPFVGPYTGYGDLYTRPPNNLFITRASFDDELDSLIRYITSVGYRRTAFVYYDNKVGEELRKDVERKLSQRGTTLMRAASMALGGDAREAARELSEQNPEVLLLGVSGSDAVAFVKAYAGTGKKTNFFARSLVSSNQLHTELGQAGEGIIISQLVPSPFKASSAIVRDYRRLLSLRGPDARPNFVEFEGFINARLMIVALRRAGPDPNRNTLQQALDSLGRVDLGGHVIDFSDRKHIGSRYVELTMLRADGTFAQ